MIYHIKQEKIFALKYFDKFSYNLFERERSNYLSIKHPLVTQYIGYIEGKSDKNLIIEYIKGTSLEKIKEKHLSHENKMKFIFEIMIIIEYLHENNFVYRDIKPDNFIIDENNTVVLIDFDRMVRGGDEINEDSTLEFSSPYIPPEVLKSNLSKYDLSWDIYSLGLIIYFIICEKVPFFNDDKNIFDEFPPEYSKLNKLCKKCTVLEPEKRPKISDLIDSFYKNFLVYIPFKVTNISIDKEFPYWIFVDEKVFHYILRKKILLKLRINFGYNKDAKILDKKYFYWILSSSHYHRKSLRELGLYYYNKSFFDIQKSIYYFEMASKQNDPISQGHLGKIYLSDEYVKCNINKALKYYTLSANNNDSRSQYILGLIYYDNKYIKRDINKAIHFLTLSANQNNQYAQSCLGKIYYNGKFIKRDINKAIHYFTLSSDKNNSFSQFHLGIIYYDGIFVDRDINKSLHYFSLSAKQNNSNAQYYLGEIYYLGKFIKRDIKKSLYYLTLSADQNNSLATNLLGEIYSENEFINRDINKAINYFTLSANQNNTLAQFNLGVIYYEGELVEEDINKAIYYFTLSEKDIPKSQFYLGIIYLSEKFGKQDINKSLHYLNLSANQNYSDSQSYLGLFYCEGKIVKRDINKGLNLLHLSASQNNSLAQYFIGKIYFLGDIVKQDIDKALYYFTLSANNGKLLSKVYLGIIYIEGKYVKQDINKAIDYLTSAADLNQDSAQYYLAKFYYEGEYVAQDINKALNYFQLSANNNNQFSQFFLGLIYYEGIYVKHDANKAVQFFILSANQNNYESQYFLGKFFYEGKICERNISKSIEYFNSSSIQFKDESSFALGFIYHEGKYVEQNIQKAIHYYKEASSFNNQYAKNNLALIYKNKKNLKDVKRNISYSITLFEEAIKQKNDRFSIFNLALIYIFGDEDIEINLDKSIDLLISAKNEIYYNLLSFVLIKKYGNVSINQIEEEIKKYDANWKEISYFLYIIILRNRYYDRIVLTFETKILMESEFYYNIDHSLAQSINEIEEKVKPSIQEKTFENSYNLNDDFYQGFGIF